MMTRFAEAICLLKQHFGLFAAIILTVWLPGNLLVNYVSHHVAGAGDIGFLKLTMWIEGLFGPLYIGALVYSLFRIKSGHAVTYREAISVGLKNWGALVGARFVAGLLMGLGFMALVVPGVILAVRYSLLDAAVIVEGKGTSQSRARSTELSLGRRWQIFWSAILFFILFMIFSIVIYLPLGFVESLDVMPVEVILDCILDIAYAVIQIVIFLFYWEATQTHHDAEPAPPPYGSPAPGSPSGNP